MHEFHTARVHNLAIRLAICMRSVRRVPPSRAAAATRDITHMRTSCSATRWGGRRMGMHTAPSRECRWARFRCGRSGYRAGGQGRAGRTEGGGRGPRGLGGGGAGPRLRRPENCVLPFDRLRHSRAVKLALLVVLHLYKHAPWRSRRPRPEPSMMPNGRLGRPDFLGCGRHTGQERMEGATYVKARRLPTSQRPLHAASGTVHGQVFNSSTLHKAGHASLSP